MKKKILSFITILGMVGLIGAGVTRALFSDTETSTDNLLQAGRIDLKIDNTSYYNGAPSPSTTWEINDLTDQVFFNFSDLKPGDTGEDTISLHVDDNEAWACMNISMTEDDDVDCTEPETDDDPTCAEPNADTGDGELAGELQFVFWADDGDNVLETDEDTGEGIFKQGNLEEVFDGQPISLADANGGVLGIGGPLDPAETYYVGKAWCFGNMELSPVPAGEGVNPTVASGITCDGVPVNNASQSDRVKVDFSFAAYQSRNNEGFTCDGSTPSITPSPQVTATITPTPLACGQADVMLVLDRSGSINSGELSTLKVAAKDFVDSLALSTTGIHGGQSSFSNTGTLNQQLTDSGATLKTAIDALTSGGFTNLKEGIDLASAELASVRDRADGASPDKMVIVTDGNPNRPLPSNTADDLAEASATAAKGAGTEIFVVGVGSDVNQSYLENDIASVGAGHYYSVSDYNGLKTTLSNLDLCE